MPRKLRIEYEGAIYHVINRGDRREPIFLDDEDRKKFLATLDEACQKTNWQVHAFCLMSNHFHLVVETPRANLVAGMKWLLGTFTARFNRRHNYSGHLFSGRYKSLIIDNGGGYLKTVCDYVHLNPARAKLIKPEDRLAAYCWSSWPEYLKRPAKRPAWIRVDRVVGEWAIKQDNAAGRRKLEQGMEQQRQLEEAQENADWKKIRRGWCWGPKSFRETLLEIIGQKQDRPREGAEELRESDEQKAERLIQQMLKDSKWKSDELVKRRKGDLHKARMAARLRNETTMTWAWIAARLEMGHWRTAANAARSVA